jgi:hypothetical protein
VVAPSPTAASLGFVDPFGTHFEVEVEWRDPWTGALRLAPAMHLYPILPADAAVFWFFEPGIPEVTVKILDGRAINGHHWLFASSMTSLEFTLRVRICGEGFPDCQVLKEYHSPPDSNLDIADVEALL